ncbi:MAG: M28 family metallopeptidase [Promethearchaeota archaeon]
MDVKPEKDNLDRKQINQKDHQMTINQENVYAIAEKLAFPRLVGSEGEKRANQIVLDEFNKAGFNIVNQDKFKTSFYNWIVLRYAFFPIGFCLFFSALTFYINPFITIGCICLGFFIAYKVLSLATTSEIKLLKNEQKNYETENIFVDSKSNNSKAKVIFIAHWDSKSQTFPSSIRILIFMIFTFGCLGLYITYLILSIVKILISFDVLLLNHILLVMSIVIVIIGCLNYFNKTANDSPGAFDNATAVGTVIELARFYKNNPVDNLDFIFLCTSSEELNLGGAKHFIQKYKKNFDRNSTYFINFDLVGGKELIRLITSYGIPRKTTSKKLAKLFLQSAKKLKISIKDIYLPTGAWSDYMPVVHEGFEACWIGSQPGLKYVHTNKDNINLISKEGIKNVLLLCIDVIEKLNNEFN